MKAKLSQYKHALLLLYFPLYLSVFHYMETVTPERIHIIESSLDQYIPFVPIFVIPYLLWFVYMGVFGIYFLFFEKESFCKMMYIGMIGMTTFLVFSYLYPNGLMIRPTYFTEDTIWIRLVKMVYSMDPARNVFPSIHVFNSVGILMVVRRSKKLQDIWWVQDGTLILTVLIVLSTMFIKQHSVFDVIAGLVLCFVSCELVYQERWVGENARPTSNISGSK